MFRRKSLIKLQELYNEIFLSSYNRRKFTSTSRQKKFQVTLLGVYNEIQFRRKVIVTYS